MKKMLARVLLLFAAAAAGSITGEVRASAPQDGLYYLEGAVVEQRRD